MKSMCLLLCGAWLLGCTIPTPPPAATEMTMEDTPDGWVAPDLGIAEVLLNERDAQT